MEDWQKQLLNNVSNRKTKKKTDTLKAKRSYAEEMRKASPQNDILRFGKKQKEFRDLGRKETVVTKINEDGDNVKSIQYLPRPGAELFRKQEQAYGDSLKLAGLAQQYGRKTPDVRKIDRSRGEITNEIFTNVKKYMKEASGLNPTVQRKLAEKRASQDLIKKYGKGIIPLLTQLENK